MMTKAIAVFALMGLSALNSLGNFYFTYGIFPRSWGAFVLFFVTGFVLMMLFSAVTKAED